MAECIHGGNIQPDNTRAVHNLGSQTQAHPAPLSDRKEGMSPFSWL